MKKTVKTSEFDRLAGSAHQNKGLYTPESPYTHRRSSKVGKTPPIRRREMQRFDESSDEMSVCGVQCAVGPKTHRHAQETQMAGAQIRFLGHIDNVDTDETSVEISFRDQQGYQKIVVVPKSELLSPSSLQRTLVDKGADSTLVDKDEIEALCKKAAYSEFRRITRRAGWHEQTFVLARASLGNPNGPTFDWKKSDGDSSRGLTAGTLERWKAGIKEPLSHSAILRFVCSVGFAAPIAALLKVDETGAFHLSGESGTGKTLSLRLVASIFGRAGELDLSGFDQTDSGLQETLASASGTVALLNEMPPIAERRAAMEINALSHLLTSGRSRNRSIYAKSKNSLLEQMNWNLFSLTTKEQSLEAITRGDRDNGARARYIDVPCPSVKDGGIFSYENQKGVDIAQNKALAAARENTITVNYGAAMPFFIVFVRRHPKRVEANFKRNTLAFVKRFSPQDPWEERFAKKFGYVLAGGFEARRAGVLDCTRRELVSAVRTMYRNARAMFKSTAESHFESVEKFRSAILDEAQFPLIEKTDNPPANFDRNVGFRRTLKSDGLVYAVSLDFARSLSQNESDFLHLKQIICSSSAHLSGQPHGLPTRAISVGGKRNRYMIFRADLIRSI